MGKKKFQNKWNVRFYVRRGLSYLEKALKIREENKEERKKRKKKEKEGEVSWDVTASG